MSRSARQWWVIGIVVVALVIGVSRALVPERSGDAISTEEVAAESATAVDARTPRKAARRSPRRSGAEGNRLPESDPTTGVEFLNAEPASPQVALSGFVVDQFSGWQQIPEDYFADGVVVRNGVLTLAGDANSTGPRSGTLQSPPLPLRSPSLAAPADETASVPEGTVIELQVSVSEDGQAWSPWYRVGRYNRPDGKRVSAGVQPTLAKADLESMDFRSSVTVVGPALRYRLGLSSSGVSAPSISDVRVWKREPL